MTRWLYRLTVVGLACALPATLSAQTSPRDARLSVTVTDQTGAIVPNAIVTIVGLETATRGVTLPAVPTTDKGLASFESLPLGRYSITAEFPGFELGLLRDIRLRSGNNTQAIVLPLKKVEESVTVGGDAQAVASTRANARFGVSLSDDQIGALSDDPADALQQLMDLAGPEAIIRVDSFEGQQLPPKSQIKSIHVTRDQFAAETELPGSTFVDVITQPGIGPIRGTATLAFHNTAMTAGSPFTPTKGDEQVRTYAANFGGALIKDKSNFSLAINGRNEYTTPNLNAALPTGTQSQVLNLRQPHNLVAINALLDYALTRDQTLRVGYSQRLDRVDNVGIGAYDLPERAFSADSNNYTLRILEAGPIGRRTFLNTRLTMSWADFGSQSAVEAPTVYVQDAFTSGGAQQSGGTRGRNVQLASDLDYVRGIHSWRTGILLSGEWYRSDQNTNYLGTYTFSSLEAYQNGEPALYTRQVGDPTVSYFIGRGAVYLQDDIRVRKTLTFSPGVRYSLQTHVSDFRSLDPRFGVTWAPFKSGRTTLRASAGMFAGWLQPFAYEQTLRLDGQHQRELIVLNPPFPDIGAEGSVAPSNKYLLGDFKLLRNVRYSAGIDHTFSPHVAINALYTYWQQLEAPRGKNLNAPVDGVRPDPAFANVIEIVTDAQYRRHDLFVNLTVNLAQPSSAANAQFFNWRRLNLTAGYTLAHTRIDTVSGYSPFAVPPSGSLDTEWGPGPSNMPYRVNVSLNSTQLKNLAVNLSWNASDGTPYNWTTGTDDNRDGLLNDRPPGVGTNSLKTAPQSTLNARVTYTFARLNTLAAPGPGADGPSRYRLGLYVSVNNLTDHSNYGGYSGVQSSPFFERPTRVLNPRKMDLGLNVSF